MEPSDRAVAERVLKAAAWLGPNRAHLVGRLLSEGRIARFSAGQWAQAEGDDEAGLLVVLSGAVQLFCKAPGDREVLIGMAGAGASLGQTTRFGGGPRLVTVVCQADSTLFQISDRALGRIAEIEPQIWEAVAALLYRQLRNLLQLAAETAALPPRQRLASRLSLLAQSAPAEGEVKVSQQNLGEMTGLSRKTVNHHLGQFEAQGLIGRGYGGLRVYDAEGLRRLAER